MSVDVDKLVASLDLTLFAQRGDEVHGLCPMHKQRTGKEDHNPSWWINTLSGYHMCFSCGYKGNLYTLVRDLNPAFDHWDIVDFLKTEPVADAGDLLKRLQDLPEYVRTVEDEIPMSESRLAVYVDPPEHALKSRKISQDSVLAYGVLWEPKEEHWILPMRDKDGKLMGWQEKGYRGRFFKNQPAGVKKSRTLFGITTQNPDVTVVVESPLDCLRIFAVGFKGAVSTFGASVSEHQAKLLRGSSKIIAAFDNDQAGEKANDELFKYANQYGLDVSFFNYGDSTAKDPGDMTDDEIKWGIENSRNMVLGRKAYAWGS